MDQIESITQAYSQAPWRRQLQLIGIFSLILVFIALVAGIYLSISARAATVGRDVQYMQNRIEILDREIEDLEIQIAYLQSDHEMQKRAESLGFREADTDQIEYILVPEFIENDLVLINQPTRKELVQALFIPPEYTESLLVWLNRQREWFNFDLIEAKH